MKVANEGCEFNAQMYDYKEQLDRGTIADEDSRENENAWVLYKEISG